MATRFQSKPFGCCSPKSILVAMAVQDLWIFIVYLFKEANIFNDFGVPWILWHFQPSRQAVSLSAWSFTFSLFCCSTSPCPGKEWEYHGVSNLGAQCTVQNLPQLDLIVQNPKWTIEYYSKSKVIQSNPSTPRLTFESFRNEDTLGVFHPHDVWHWQIEGPKGPSPSWKKTSPVLIAKLDKWANHAM